MVGKKPAFQKIKDGSTLRYGMQVRSNFKPKKRLKIYASERYVNTVWLNLQGTGTEYALFNPQKAERYVKFGTF